MTLGLYGKLPDRGDFVSRGVAPPLETALHAFGASLMTYGLDVHGKSFPDIFAQMPPYVMLAAGGSMVDPPVVGVFGPSADAVGRLFPLFLITSGGEETEKIDRDAYTEAVQLVDAAAFDKTPLTDVEQHLSELSLTLPTDCEGLWLAEWSVNGPAGKARQYKDLEEVRVTALATLLTPEGTA